jgi:site-specific DNA-methyltransferase (adenine-specific)
MNPYYQHAAITIYHGDCNTILTDLPRHDLLLTDPPYGAGYAANPIVGKGKKKSNHASQDWDHETPEEAIELALSKSGDQIIWGGNYLMLMPSRCWLVWYKRDSPPSMADVELAWVSRDGNARLFDFPIAAANSERIGHPTQKPLALMKWCLSLFPDAKTVLDPFSGSGTTGVACKAMGLTCTMIEREERYCEIAAKRLSQEVFDFGEATA